jgi:hypothetical protein
VALAGVDQRVRRHPTELDDTQLERLLGAVPDNEWRRGLRDGLIEEIHTYRRRWNVTDPRHVLGPHPADPDHQHDRDELADTLRAAARALGTSPQPAGIGKVQERQQPAQSRGLAAER